MDIRNATEADLPAILAITNDAILNTTSSWNVHPTTLEARRQWLAERQAAGLPVLVGVIGGDVAGFGSYGSFRAWDGYRLTVEHSIYVDAAFRRRGVGRLLLAGLIEHATEAGMHVMMGVISADNEISIALHEQFGFTVAGRLAEVGRKFDRWLDLVLMQKMLAQLAD
ncbi:N-acetyltransferase family protein [Acidisoma sp.]|uniref:GNAT family N-acetyltransferase n=1 Tax=Acidisoma sp. TaxID=1872115 RepID=UPI003AFFE0DA